MKKICFLFFVFLAINVFSYDGTIAGGIDGNFNYLDWMREASDNLDLVRRTLRTGFGNDIQIKTLYQIGLLDRDSEDIQMLGDLERYLRNNYSIHNNDAFSHYFLRGRSDNGLDAWFVFSHYVGAFGFGTWNHIIYYFSITY